MRRVARTPLTSSAIAAASLVDAERCGLVGYGIGRRVPSVRHGARLFPFPREPTDWTQPVCVFAHSPLAPPVWQVWPAGMRQGRHNVSLDRRMACSIPPDLPGMRHEKCKVHD